MTAAHLRLEQSAKILDALARVVAAGYRVTVERGLVTVTPPGGRSFTIARSDVRDGLANSLQPVVWDLDSDAKDRAALLERLVSEEEPRNSGERDLREAR